ncbi:MAG TPA: SDR family NAD(P)-dependent oxidoreductase [Streptosporangiaceae bacterium]|nr:SDR family NAD(P)-dependent oxidoreductase [Streptosporangiaceae bacterium]
MTVTPVALVARNPARLDAFTGELAADGITAAGFTGDLADRDALPGMIEAITARLGPIDVLEYAPSGLDLLNHAAAVRDADAASFEFPLDLLLRTPVTLIRQVLPGMLERGDGAVLFGLPVNASIPVPQFGNIGTAAAAARHYLHTLHADLAGTGVYAGLLQITGPVGDATPAITSSRTMTRLSCRSRKTPPFSPTPCGTSTSSATASTKSSG